MAIQQARLEPLALSFSGRETMFNSARGIDGGPRRFTEVVLNEQSLPVASMKSSRSQDETSATRAKTSLAAMAAVAILASRAARIVAFRSNLTPCGWGVL